MANQSVKIKEEQLRREEEKLREIEFKVQREIQVKRQELLAKEDSLKVLEARLGERSSLTTKKSELTYSVCVVAAQHTGHSRDGAM
jgi:cell division control protein 11